MIKMNVSEPEGPKSSVPSRQSETRNPKSTIAPVLAEAESFLKKRGTENSRLDAEVLLAFVLQTERHSFYSHPEQSLTAEQQSHFWDLLRRRAKGEPLAYLRGEKEFFSLPFYVDRAVLIPRPETELVVEAAIEAIRMRNAECGMRNDKDETSFHLFDVGTGSGAIVVAVLVNAPGARAVASDVSPAALDVARRNTVRHGVADRLTLIEGDLFGDWTGEVDVVVSNPPYVADDEREILPRDVRDFEPDEALFAGADGLSVIRRLIDEAPDHLPPGGRLIFEIGYGKGSDCRQLLDADGRWTNVEILNDLAGIPRVITAQRGKA